MSKRKINEILLLFLCPLFLMINADAQTLRGAEAIEFLHRSENSSLTKSFLQTVEEGQVGSRFLQGQKLTASDGAMDDQFGISVSTDGETAVIGIWNDDVGANANQGSAYVFMTFDGKTWLFHQKLVANDGAAGDSFGYSVAVGARACSFGGVIMIGAFGADIDGRANQGAVYVFRRNPFTLVWGQTQKLFRSNGAANDAFGNSVAMTSAEEGLSHAIIGANGDDGTFQDQGAAYIYACAELANSFVPLHALSVTAADGAAFRANFGWSVGISGDFAIVGTNYTASVDGRFYIFERSESVYTLRAQGSQSVVRKLGFSVAISGRTAIVGGPETAVGPNAGQGEAYVYERGNSVGDWPLTKVLRAPDGAAGDNFGRSVAASIREVIVGAPMDDIGTGSNRGSAYSFRKVDSDWINSSKMTAFDGAAQDTFGNSVAIDPRSEWALIGAPAGNAPNSDQGAAYLFENAKEAPFDFDRDGKTDIGIFRPAQGEWWVNRSRSNTTFAAQFGAATDRIVPADYTGDGRTDIAVWRPGTGQWFVLRSEDSSFFAFPFGSNGDIPAPADYDGDRRADAGLFRPSDSTWYIIRSTDGGTTIVQFGANGDAPVPADYDGDGLSDIAIFRPSLGQWWINRSSGGVTAAAFGNSADKPVQGDYTGDGTADIAFWRPSSGVWFVLRSESSSFFSFPFGAAGDIPVPGDYDGDAQFDAAVFRPSQSTWFINPTTAVVQIRQFGVSGDRPIPNAFVP